MLFLGGEFALTVQPRGFPPRAWLDLYTLWPNLATLAQNGQTSYVILLWVQAICWLVAWLASILMALLIVSYLAGKVQPTQAEENLALRHYFSQEDTMIMPVISGPTNDVTTVSLTSHFTCRGNAGARSGRGVLARISLIHTL